MVSICEFNPKFSALSETLNISFSFITFIPELSWKTSDKNKDIDYSVKISPVISPRFSW